MAEISESSRRIAKNTVMLYCRMFVLLLVGLFTSRVVLGCLGVENYGIYNVVGGLVSMFMIVTNAITHAITRYINFELGKGQGENLRRIFSTSVIIQILLGLVVVILTETVGLYLVNNVLDLPAGRRGDAAVVLQFSMVVLILQLLNVPYNAVIIAHEKMNAFAMISILEAFLKLLVAFCLFISPADKLLTYSALMMAVSAIVRFTYISHCRRHFEETRGRPSFERGVFRRMLGFAGWNFLGVSGYILNTQGVNTVANTFFGVTVNAARGISAQVEGITRQFINNINTALIPQITQSYAKGEYGYCFELVRKSARYSFLVMSVFIIPMFLEGEQLIRLWLGQVPEHAVLFTQLGMLATLSDTLGSSLAQLELAYGKIKRYYLVIGPLSSMAFLFTWIAYIAGADPEASYWIFILVYVLMLAAKLIILKMQVGFPVIRFLLSSIVRPLVTVCLAYVFTAAIWRQFPESILRLIVTLVAGTIILAVFSYLFAFTEGEREFVKSKLKNVKKA